MSVEEALDVMSAAVLRLVVALMKEGVQLENDAEETSAAGARDAQPRREPAQQPFVQEQPPARQEEP